jgi:hypothetical protein
MKIIKLDKKNPHAEKLYDALDKILYFGAEYLPFIFLKKVYLDGHMLQLPKWITKKHMDSIDKHVQDLMNNLNWEDGKRIDVDKHTEGIPE